MARSPIQFQRCLSLSEFQRLYSTEEQCEAAMEKARWPDGFRCPRCNGHEHGLVYGRRLKHYQCRNCSHQAIITGGKHPKDLPQFRWINTLLGNIKTSLSSTFHAFNFGKHARR